MTCVKTGARIYFRNYGMLVAGDVYIVQDTYIFRWNPDSVQYVSNDENATHEVEYIENSESWWHRADLGVTVVPEYLVTAWAER